MSAAFIVEYEDIESVPNVQHSNIYRLHELHNALADFLHAIDVAEDATLRWSS